MANHTPIHVSAKALTELQLSQWQELIDTLTREGEDDPKTIAYCEFIITYLQSRIEMFGKGGRADA